MERLLKQKQGFTLIELLVVVAIIGVLVTAGVPQYKKMMQKSKKGEAKLLLGAVANAESAFFSEFGAYGSNLASMGVQVDSQSEDLIYAVGFTAADCSARNGAAVPVDTTTWGKIIKKTAKGFYDNYVEGDSSTQGSEVFGRYSRSAGCYDVGAIPNTYDSYLAAASGVIKPGKDLDTSTDTDQWTINQNRALINEVDGIDK